MHSSRPSISIWLITAIVTAVTVVGCVDSSAPEAPPLVPSVEYLRAEFAPRLTRDTLDGIMQFRIRNVNGSSDTVRNVVVFNDAADLALIRTVRFEDTAMKQSGNRIYYRLDIADSILYRYFLQQDTPFEHDTLHWTVDAEIFNLPFTQIFQVYPMVYFLGLSQGAQLSKSATNRIGYSTRGSNNEADSVRVRFETPTGGFVQEARGRITSSTGTVDLDSTFMSGLTAGQNYRLIVERSRYGRAYTEPSLDIMVESISQSIIDVKVVE